MKILATNNKASLELTQTEANGQEIVLTCQLDGDFAAARLANIAVDRSRGELFVSRLKTLKTDPAVLQSAKPGELVIAFTAIPDADIVLVKATMTRLKEIGQIRASDMLTLSFEIAMSEIARLESEAKDLIS